MEEKKYVPFGDEWRREMMKWTKTRLYSQFGVSSEGRTKAQMVEKIRSILMTIGQ